MQPIYLEVQLFKAENLISKRSIRMSTSYLFEFINNSVVISNDDNERLIQFYKILEDEGQSKFSLDRHSNSKWDTLYAKVVEYG